jgi:hypothetical protein
VYGIDFVPSWCSVGTIDVVCETDKVHKAGEVDKADEVNKVEEVFKADKFTRLTGSTRFVVEELRAFVKLRASQLVPFIRYYQCNVTRRTSASNATCLLQKAGPQPWVLASVATVESLSRITRYVLIVGQLPIKIIRIPACCYNKSYIDCVRWELFLQCGVDACWRTLNERH